MKRKRLEDNNSVIVNQYPDEFWYTIFGYFGSRRTLKRIACTSHQFKRLSQDSSLLKKITDYRAILITEASEPIPQDFQHVILKGSGHIAIFHSSGNQIQIIDIDSRQLIEKHEIKDLPSIHHIFQYDSERIIVTSGGHSDYGSIIFWNLKKRAAEKKYPALQTQLVGMRVSDLALLYDEKGNDHFLVFIRGTGLGPIEVIDVIKNETFYLRQDSRFQYFDLIKLNNHTIATYAHHASKDSRIEIWDIPSKKCLHQLPAKNNNCILLLSDGHFINYGNSTLEIIKWDEERIEVKQSFSLDFYTHTDCIELSATQFIIWGKHSESDHVDIHFHLWEKQNNEWQYIGKCSLKLSDANYITENNFKLSPDGTFTSLIQHQNKLELKRWDFPELLTLTQTNSNNAEEKIEQSRLKRFSLTD